MYYTEYADDCQSEVENLMKTILNIDFMIYLKEFKEKRNINVWQIQR